MVERGLDRHQPHHKAGRFASGVVQPIWSSDSQIFLWIVKPNQTEDLPKDDPILPLYLANFIFGLALHSHVNNSVIVFEKA